MSARGLADGIELRLKLMAEADEAGMDGLAKSLGYFIASFSSEILTALRAAPEPELRRFVQFVADCSNDPGVRAEAIKLGAKP